MNFNLILQQAGRRSYFLILLMFLIVPQECRAWPFLTDWPWTTPSRKVISVSADFLLSLTLHPTTVDSSYTPPPLLSPQVGMTFWFSHKIGFYGYFSWSIGSAYLGTQIYGGGIKIPLIAFLTFSPNVHSYTYSPTAFIKGVSFQMLLEGAQYKFATLEPQDQFEKTGFTYRGGFEVDWYFKSPKFYLHSAAMVGNMVQNLFMTGNLGLGWNL